MAKDLVRRVGLDVGASYNGCVKCVEVNVGSIGHRRFECKELISEALAMDIPRFLNKLSSALAMDTLY